MVENPQTPTQMVPNLAETESGWNTSNNTVVDNSTSIGRITTRPIRV